MKRLQSRSLARFGGWSREEIAKALALIDHDARHCGKGPLDAEVLNFILQRLTHNYFLNRHKRDIYWARKAFDTMIPETYRDLPATIDRCADHWTARALSPMEDAQEDAKLFAANLRLENVYLWFLVGNKIHSINPEHEGHYWRVRVSGFKTMAL